MCVRKRKSQINSLSKSWETEEVYKINLHNVYFIRPTIFSLFRFGARLKMITIVKLINCMVSGEEEEKKKDKVMR